MALFGCANDEQFLDELSELDYDLHYCEYINECNPDKNCYPALNSCKAYRRKNAK